METKIFGYPSKGLHTDQATRLQWAKENGMIFSIEDFQKSGLTLNTSFFDWDIIHNPKKKYFLFGEVGVRAYNNKTFQQIQGYVYSGDCGVVCWHESEGINLLLKQFDGWNAFVEITEKEYIEFLPPPKPKLLASKFLAWYTADSDTQQILSRRTSERMQSIGYEDISVNELFDECGEIPEYIFENYTTPLEEAECKYYNPHEIEFINDLKK